MRSTHWKNCVRRGGIRACTPIPILRKNRLDMAKLSAYPFFVADYTGSVTYPGAYQMWQYSSTGRVPGISGNVDLDHSYVDFLPAIQAGGYNGYEPEIPGLEMVPVPG